MTLYETLLIAHVLGVILWLGSAVSNALLLARATSSGDMQRLVIEVENGRWIDLRVGMPASLVVLVAGGWLMTAGNWPFDTSIWIHIGMTALLAAVAVATLWTARHQRKLLAQAATGTAAVNSLASRILWGMNGSIVLILIGLWAMIDKPTSG